MENITYHQLKPKGESKEVAGERAQELLVLFTDKATAYPQSLSGGQQQTDRYCTWTGYGTRCLLFDEPTSAQGS